MSQSVTIQVAPELNGRCISRKRRNGGTPLTTESLAPESFRQLSLRQFVPRYPSGHYIGSWPIWYGS